MRDPASPASAFQSASASIRREMWFASGAVASWKIATTRSASGTASGAPMPPRPRVVRMRIHAPGIANSANQPMPFREVPLRVVRELVREHDLLLVLARTASSSIVSQKTTRRDGPRPNAYAFACSVSSLTSSTRIGMSPTPSSALVLVAPPRAAPDRRSGSVVKSRYGATNVNSAAMRDEHGRAREPPPVAEPAREAHHDRGARCRSRGTARRGSPSPRTASRGSRARSARCAAPTSARRSGTGGGRARRCRARASRGASPCRSAPPTDSRAKPSAAPRVEPERQPGARPARAPRARRRSARSASRRATKSAPKTASTSTAGSARSSGTAVG